MMLIEPAWKQMLLVGLTGGIASGKSTVSAFLRQEGAVIIDADEISHDLIRKGNPAYQPVLSVFGEEIVGPHGEIDRKKLGAIVFNNPVQRDFLNRIIHPLVFSYLEAEKKKITRKDTQALIIFDAPLLIEAKVHQKMDWVLLVYVDLKTQIDRLIKRDSLTHPEAAQRIASQMPIEQKLPLADEIIDNRKPIHEVKKVVHEVYLRLLRRGDASP